MNKYLHLIGLIKNAAHQTAVVELQLDWNSTNFSENQIDDGRYGMV